MKKKLEAELISIAHRILKLKNKSELDQLYLETQKLYEKLAVLKFVEENFSDLQPTIGRAEADEILATAFEEKQDAAPAEETALETPAAAEKLQPEEDKGNEKEEEKEEEKIQEPTAPEEEKLQAEVTPTEQDVDEVVADAEEVAEASTQEPETAPEIETDDTPVVEAGIEFQEPETKEEIAAAIPEAKQEDLFKPSFEWTFENKTEEAAETPTEPESEKQTSAVAFEDLLGEGYKDPVFVKPEDENPGTSYGALAQETDAPAEDNRVEPVFSEPKPNVIPITSREDKVPVFKMNPETALGDRLSKGITVGLNDRIAFVKNLFNNSNEDYNRVLSQLITFNSYAEAQDFIAHMVKPDYNNWDGKEEFEQRFMEVIEKKFS